MMENNLQVFVSKEFGQVRTVKENGNVLFCGVDTARALGYINPSSALHRHCRNILKLEVPTNGGNQKLMFITEGDVFRLIIRSKLPAAEKFEQWMCDKVMPSLYKTGLYDLNDSDVLTKTLVMANNILSKKENNNE